MSIVSPYSSTVGPVPIVVGVAGHRDLRTEDRPALERRVREILSDLRTRYPATPFVLLSALAEGADRLVARSALELGFRLIVPLPMTREDYAKDFPDSVAEFDALLAQAEQSFTLEPFEEQTGTGQSDDPTWRAHRYATAAAYVARHCQILLALWDGRNSDAIGGTAHTVRFKRAGVDVPYGPPRSPLDLVEGGLVYHLITPRASNPATDGQPLTLVKLAPHDQPGDPKQAEADHARVLAWENEFNRDAANLSTVLATEREKSQSYVFPEAVVDKLPGPVRASLSLYTMADVLALHYARRTVWTLRILLVLAFAATLAFQLYAFVPNKPVGLLFAYVALGYGACPLVYLWARFVGNYQIKYLDYRALAEGLRVLMFWRLAGLKMHVADHYLRKQRSEMDWIRQAIRNSTLQNSREDRASELTDTERLRLVLTNWAEDQAGFFRKRSRKDRRAARWFGYIGMGLYLLGVVLPLTKVVSDTHHPVIVVMSLCVVVAALVHLYSRVLGFDEHAAQYERMSRVFEKGQEHLQAALDAGRLEDARHLIVELGQEALIENGEWLLFHRSQPVGVPGIGAE